jgi:hypothetical protein
VLILLANIVPAHLLVFVDWVRVYYKSMENELPEDGMNRKRSIWFRATGIAPCNRIINLNVQR